MPFWDLPDAAVRVPIGTVVVCEEHLAGDQPRYVSMDVQSFVITMVQDGHYPLRNLPREAVISAAVDYHICTIENGGYAGFVGNSGWDAELRDNIREGLAVLSLHELAALFAELEAFAQDDPAAFEASDWSHPIIRSLDERFGGLPRQQYFERHAAWIKSWPFVRAVPGREHQAVMATMAERNRKRRRWWH